MGEESWIDSWNLCMILGETGDLQATCTGSSVNDTSYWNIRADQSLQNMLKLGTLLHNSRCRKYVGWCRLCRKNQSSGPIVDDLGSRHPCQRHWPEYLATSVWWPAKRREAGLRAKWPGGVGYGWIVGCNLQGKLTSQTKWQVRIGFMKWIEMDVWWCMMICLVWSLSQIFLFDRLYPVLRLWVMAVEPVHSSPHHYQVSCWFLL